MIEVRDICDRLNGLAPQLAPRLLPNGKRSGNYWMASGIDDTGQSASLALCLAGARCGHWVDHGSARAGEERGDMLDLVQLIECGGDKRRALDWAKCELGIEDEFTPAHRPAATPEERARRAAEARARAEARERELATERERKAKNARRLFLSAVPIAGTPAELYLRGRGIEFRDWPGSLRFHPGAYCGPLHCERPAMVAGIFDAAGRQIGAHRTFLELCKDGWWRKLSHPDLDDPKMVLGNQWGGFVPINKGASGKSMRAMPEGEPVYVTEGIEDALCVRLAKPEARIVCAMNLNNIGGILLPPAALRLVIVCDRDEKPKARDALEHAIARQQARGLRVQIVIPPSGFKDINEWLQGLAAAAPGKRRA